MVHCCDDHWILASIVHDDSSDRVMIYDSLYDNIDVKTLTVIHGLFGPTAVPEIYKSIMELEIVEFLLLHLEITVLVSVISDT